MTRLAALWTLLDCDELRERDKFLRQFLWMPPKLLYGCVYATQTATCVGACREQAKDSTRHVFLGAEQWGQAVPIWGFVKWQKVANTAEPLAEARQGT